MQIYPFGVPFALLYLHCAMAKNPMPSANELLHSLLERLQDDHAKFTHLFLGWVATQQILSDRAAFADAFLLTWLIVHQPEFFLRAFQVSAPKKKIKMLESDADEVLGNVLCLLLEARLIQHWHALEHKARSKPQRGNAVKPNLYQLRDLWGGLVLHLKLALPREPLGESNLYDGKVVTVAGSTPFPIAAPFSEKQSRDMLAALGDRFLREYADNYIRSEELTTVIIGLAESASANRKSILMTHLPHTRTLNRYVDEFALTIARGLLQGCKSILKATDTPLAKLIANSPSIEAARDEMIQEAACELKFVDAEIKFLFEPARTRKESRREEILPPAEKELPRATIPQTEEEKIPRADIPISEEVRIAPAATSESQDTAPRVESVEALAAQVRETIRIAEQQAWEKMLIEIREHQASRLRAKHTTTFIIPTLRRRDGHAEEWRHVLFDDALASAGQRVIVSAPPGGGKTRLQDEWILRNAACEPFHFAINVFELYRSRMASFLWFAANSFRALVSQPVDSIGEFQSQLQIMELQHRIVWHLDGWDEIPNADREAVAAHLAVLSQFTLATFQPCHAIHVFRANQCTIDAVIEIQPFESAQAHDFVDAYIADKTKRAAIKQRAHQVTGLAALPRGLKYLCDACTEQSLVEFFAGYINQDLQRLHETPFKVNSLTEELCHFGWKPPAPTLAAAYKIATTFVSAWQVDSRLPFNKNIGLTPACLAEIRVQTIFTYMNAGSPEKNWQTTMEHMECAVRGRLMQPNEDGESFRFVVPELGYLLIAIAFLERTQSMRWLMDSFKALQTDPANPIFQMMVVLSLWREDRMLRAS